MTILDWNKFYDAALYQYRNNVKRNYDIQFSQLPERSERFVFPLVLLFTSTIIVITNKPKLQDTDSQIKSVYVFKYHKILGIKRMEQLTMIRKAWKLLAFWLVARFIHAVKRLLMKQGWKLRDNLLNINFSFVLASSKQPPREQGCPEFFFLAGDNFNLIRWTNIGFARWKMTLLVFSSFFFGGCHNNAGLTVLSSGFGQAPPVTVKKLSHVESLISFAECVWTVIWLMGDVYFDDTLGHVLLQIFPNQLAISSAS